MSREPQVDQSGALRPDQRRSKHFVCSTVSARAPMAKTHARLDAVLPHLISLWSGPS